MSYYKYRLILNDSILTYYIILLLKLYLNLL